MAAERNLTQLLASMAPELLPETYVFTTVDRTFKHEDLCPTMIFQEQEGTTLILEQSTADANGLKTEFPCRMITLNIHSALDAVGFLAAITSKLAELNMGANPVSAFYHDHLFIPEDRAEDAMLALKELSSAAN